MSYIRLNPDYSGAKSLTTSNLSAGTIKYAKFGKVVVMMFDNMKVATAGSYVIGIVPEGYRPYGMTIEPFIRDNTGTCVLQSWIVATNGEIHAIFKTANLAHAGMAVWLTA